MNGIEMVRFIQSSQLRESYLLFRKIIFFSSIEEEREWPRRILTHAKHREAIL